VASYSAIIFAAVNSYFMEVNLRANQACSVAKDAFGRYVLAYSSAILLITWQIDAMLHT
jgi:hypothetical protein